jgi:hypothetical protein
MIGHSRDSVRRVGMVIAAMGSACIGAETAQAGPLGTVVRRVTRVTDDTPNGEIDDVTSRLTRSGLSREAIEAELRRAGRWSDHADDAARTAARSAEVARVLRPALAGHDPSLVLGIDVLDDAARKSVAILVRGGEQFGAAVPDLAARGRLLGSVGAEAVAAIGLYGEEAVDSALRLDAALLADAVTRPGGLRAITLNDFGRLMVDHGPAARRFWGRYVRSHWKTWLASGALAAYLVAPETFMDTLGDLTEEGMRRLTALAGPVAAAAIRGTTAGVQEIVEQVGGAARDALLHRWGGMTALAVFALTLAFPRTRAALRRPWRALMRVPTRPSTGPAKTPAPGCDAP